jgi:hypothetical protein
MRAPVRRPNFFDERLVAERRHTPLSAQLDGFSLHAGLGVKAGERRTLERLLRYGSRPPFAQKRLSVTPSGKVRLKLRKPYYTGQTELLLEPEAFVCTAVGHRAAATVAPDPLPRHILRPPPQAQKARRPATHAATGSRRICPARPTSRPAADPTLPSSILCQAAVAGLRARHRVLPTVRRSAAPHRLHRRARDHLHDSHPSGPTHRRA